MQRWYEVVLTSCACLDIFYGFKVKYENEIQAVVENSSKFLLVLHVEYKGYFSEVFSFKPQGWHSPLSGLNRKPWKNPLFCLLYDAEANKHVLLSSDEIYIRSSLHRVEGVN